MMTRAVVAAALALSLVPSAAQAQRVSGRAVAVDGDTLAMTGFRIRLFGIDAVERAQACERNGAAWACGEEAKALLEQLVADRIVDCDPRDRDDYERLVSVCRVSGRDLAVAMVEAGLAVPLTQYSEAYVSAAERARVQRAGIWAGAFDEPAAWRAAHRAEEAPVRLAGGAAGAAAAGGAAGAAAGGGAAPVVRQAAPADSSGVYYRNCAAARAAGAAPLYRGQPGYRPEMDGDSDGIACEPYRGRR